MHMMKKTNIGKSNNLKQRTKKYKQTIYKSMNKLMNTIIGNFSLPCSKEEEKNQTPGIGQPPGKWARI